MKRISFVGLDVHAETITVALAEQSGELRSLGAIPNRGESIRKLIRRYEESPGCGGDDRSGTRRDFRFQSGTTSDGLQQNGGE